ncbi:MAG: HAMP domain-containing histidine kinase [Candidatus Thorarchaeota archaeon]|nr:MAG: HAMP domain-containing histidine kinase [Candidatus Thorarchaeota archaeon]
MILQSHGGFTIRQILSRVYELPFRLTEPAPEVESGGATLKARYLSTALFAACIVFPFLQIASESVGNRPIYSLMSFFVAALYLLSRTKYVNYVASITVTTVALIPFVIMMTNPVWTGTRILFQILSWPVLAVVIGSQLLTPRREGMLVFGISVGLIVVAIAHPGIGLEMAAEPIAVSIALGVLLFFGSWTLGYYIEKLEKRHLDLEEKQKELEIYTSLLTHDLSNDLQVVLGGLELASFMLPPHEGKVEDQLKVSHAASVRMSNLLRLFSAPPPEEEMDFVTIVERIAQRAEETSIGLTITVNADDDTRGHIVTSRLVGSVFQNLFRNAVQHAGETPVVDVAMSLNNDLFEVIVQDDGPGVNPEMKSRIFGRSSATPEGTGVGLYLTRKIMDLLGGTIKLMNTPGQSGSRFKLVFPAETITGREPELSRILREQR